MNYRGIAVAVTLIWGLVACDGGGGGGGGGGGSSDGLILSKSGTIEQYRLKSYRFSAAQHRAYSGRLVSTSGNADLIIADGTGSSSTILDTSMSSGVDDVSFIAPESMTLYARVYGYNASSSYTLKIFDNHLTVNGPTRTRETKSQPIYLSFDALAGQAYIVKVDPISGDPRLRVYTHASSYSPDTSTMVGDSNNTGSQPESIVFIATESKTHYLTVSNTNTSAEMSFSASVETSDAAADLQVSVNSLSYSNGKLTVNYTVSNSGVAHSSGVYLHFWLDSDTTPTAGSAGDDQVYISGIAPASSYTANRIIDVGILEFGTLYAYVDPEGILPEADETNNVSAGRPWSAPVQAPKTFDFEDSLTPTAFSFSGNADWNVVTGGAHDASNYSFRSNIITASQTACFQVAVNGAKSVTFDWKALYDTSSDYLRFYVNGYSSLTYSASNSWESKSYTFSSAGLNTIKWCYLKGSYDELAVDDGGWVDNIVFQPERPDLSVALNTVDSDGAELTISYTVTNHTGAAAASTTIDIWADLSAAPTMGSTGDIWLDLPVIAGNSSFTGIATVPSIASAGTAYAIVDTNDTLIEQNENNNVSAGKNWVYYGEPLARYDFEDESLPENFVTSGHADWIIDDSAASSGAKSIRAGVITHSQSACTAVTVNDSSAIIFDWKVSSEGRFDYLRFYIDGTEQPGKISGTTSWASKEFAGLTLGTHEFKWCYTKDSSVSAGADTGWIDNIRVY